MTKETGYREMRARFSRLVEEAKRTHRMVNSKQTAERLEYLQGRLKRYTI